MGYWSFKLLIGYKENFAYNASTISDLTNPFFVSKEEGMKNIIAYEKEWNHLLKSLQNLLSKKDLKKDSLEEFKGENLKNVTIDIPPAGSIAAYNALKDFSKRLDEYKEARDIPKDNGTSRLSHFLKNGSLTSAHVMYYYQLNKYSKKDKSSKDVYFSELIWREFYYHVLYHFPHVETKAFNEKYENLKWENNDDYFKAWKEGKTGFPIVDAGMRELNSTGHMHNRVRMIVASFLTKDLLIDWRWGEKYFMDKLLDGDLAANNGGWQWAASTGCDAQPYFRIFNPWTQSKRFDPQGDYIKKYIPELKDVESKKLHKPITEHSKYPPPIIDHSEQREKALLLYKA